MSTSSLADVVCTHCGCLCDDIRVTLGGGRITAAEHACERGRRWFLGQLPAGEQAAARPVCRIRGQAASLEDGIVAAAEILSAARAPLVYGLTETSCEAQRVAVALADLLGANLDTPTSAAGPVGLGLHSIGEVTATLGEIANRGDVLIYWGCDPAADEPRHFERYTLDRPGMFLPHGRADRAVIVVGTQPTATSAAADQFVPLKPGADFAALWVLRALVQAAPKGTDHGAADAGLDPAVVEQATGQPLSLWKPLADRMRQAHFGAMFYDAQLPAGSGGSWNVEALLALVHDLNVHARFVARALHGGGNPVGADNVLTWQTGYPYAINFAAGFPRFNPDDYRAERLVERGEVDAALILAADPRASWPAAAAERLAALPLVSIDWRATATSEQAAVAFHTSTYGIHHGGIVYRTDDVPLPLRPLLASELPSDVQILGLLEERLRRNLPQ